MQSNLPLFPERASSAARPDGHFSPQVQEDSVCKAEEITAPRHWRPSRNAYLWASPCSSLPGKPSYVFTNAAPQLRNSMDVGKQRIREFYRLRSQREINFFQDPTRRSVKISMISQNVVQSFFFPVLPGEMCRDSNIQHEIKNNSTAPQPQLRKKP